MTTQKTRRRRRPKFILLAVQGAAILVGALLLTLGLLGFVPGATTNIADLRWLDHDSGAALFGIFTVSVLHNLLHITLGVAGLILARSYALARAYLLGGGALLLGLWVYGLVDGGRMPDSWLHFGFGVAMIILGLTLASARVPTGAGGEELATEAE